MLVSSFIHPLTNTEVVSIPWGLEIMLQCQSVDRKCSKHLLTGVRPASRGRVQSQRWEVVQKQEVTLQ